MMGFRTQEVADAVRNCRFADKTLKLRRCRHRENPDWRCYSSICPLWHDCWMCGGRGWRTYESRPGEFDQPHEWTDTCNICHGEGRIFEGEVCG